MSELPYVIAESRARIIGRQIARIAVEISVALAMSSLVIHVRHVGIGLIVMAAATEAFYTLLRLTTRTTLTETGIEWRALWKRQYIGYADIRRMNIAHHWWARL